MWVSLWKYLYADIVSGGVPAPVFTAPWCSLTFLDLPLVCFSVKVLRRGKLTFFDFVAY